MAKHLGIVACSAEGAALCYRTICAEGCGMLGEHAHPEITLHTYPLAAYMVFIREGDWPGVAELMLASVEKCARAGAELAICPDNTIHQAFDLVEPRSPVPWLHIARVVGDEARKRGLQRLGILGTRYLMEGPVYPDALKRLGMDCEVPDDADRGKIDAIIFRELVYGLLHDDSRRYFNAVIQKLKERGCDAAVLGCTEIPLIVDPEDSPLPTLDSTRLLARAALHAALEDE
jgi:aspartate racemase